MHKGLKLLLELELPQEPEYRPTLLERVESCMEQVEYGNSPRAYHFLKKVNDCAVKCYRAGKRSDKLSELLGILTPFLAKHAAEDWRGVDLIEEFVTNPEYKDKQDAKD